ncbi:MAG: hypothetical protein WC773_02360 [Patescibacteria group bacterium]|jgi:hypothetical protein
MSGKLSRFVSVVVGIVVVAALAIAAHASTPPVVGVSYTAKVLPTPYVNPIYSSPFYSITGMSPSGDTIVGYWNQSYNNKLLVWRRGVLDATSPIHYSSGRGVNDAGVIAGYSYYPSQASTWDGTVQKVMGVLSGNISGSYAYDLNSRMFIVGESVIYHTPDGTPPNTVATIWRKDGQPFNIHSNIGEHTSSAKQINAVGQVLGTGGYWTLWTNWVTFDAVWTPSGPDSTNGSWVRLPGHAPDERCHGEALNDRGHVVGRTSLGPAFWDEAGVHDLPAHLVLGPGWPFAINNDDLIVGARFYSPTDTGMLWANGEAYNLNDLIPKSAVLICAGKGISEDGRIAANGFLDATISNSFRPFVLTPIRITGLASLPPVVKAGTTPSVLVSVDTVAPAEGIVITLSSSSAGVIVPYTVTIPAGTKSAWAKLNVKTISVAEPVTITAATVAVKKTMVLASQ